MKLSLPAFALFLIFSLGLGGRALAQTSEQVLRWYELSGLVTAGMEPTERVDPRLHLQLLETLEPESYDIDLGPVQRVDSADLGQFIVTALDAVVRGEEFTVDVQRERLRVEGSEALHARVRGLLRAATDELLASARVEVFLVNGKHVPAGTGARLSAVQAAELIRVSGARRQATDTSRLGQRLVLGRESLQGLLMDYDAEVAQFISTADPAVTVLFEGCQVGAVLLPRADGGLWLRAWGRSGEVLSVTGSQISTRYEGLDVEVPKQATRHFFASGSIEDGGALLVGSTVAQSDLWLIRASRSGEPASPGDGDGGLLIPLAELVAPAISVEAPLLPRAQPSGGMYGSGSINAEWLRMHGNPPLDPWVLVESIEARMEEGVPAGYACVLGSSLWVHGSEAYKRAAEAATASYRESPGSAFAEMELIYGVYPTQEAEALAATEDGVQLAAGLQASGAAHRIVSAARMGDTTVLVDGVERHYLKDFDVEIGPESGIADPIMEFSFAGASLTARATPTPDGRLSVWCDLQVQEDGASHQHPVAFWDILNLFERPDPAQPEFNPNQYVEIELPSTQPAGLSGVRLVRSGGWISLGSCRLGSSDRVLVAALRVTAY